MLTNYFSCYKLINNPDPPTMRKIHQNYKIVKLSMDLNFWDIQILVFMKFK